MIFSNQLQEIHPKQTCFYHFLTQKDSQTQHKRLAPHVLLTFPGSQAIREKLQQPGQEKNLIAGTKAGFVIFQMDLNRIW